MPRFEVTHQGSRYEITAPDEATALKAFEAQIASPQVEQMPTRTGTFAAGVRGLADTLTFGGSDEIGAALSAATGLHGTFGDYEGNLARARAAHAYDERSNPVARMVGQVAGGVGSGLGMARAGLLATPKMAGAAFPVRAAVAAGEGATLGTAYGLGSGTDAEDRLVRGLENIPAGAAFGVVGEAIAPAVSRAAGFVADKFRQADPAEALANARRVIQEATGFKPEEIPDALASEFAERAKRAVDPTATARETAAAEFGIHLPRGQALRDIDQQAFEESARHGAKGAAAGNVMRELDERNAAAIAAQKNVIAEGLDAGRPLYSTAQDELMGNVLAKTREAERASWEGVRSHYKAGDQLGAAVQVEAVQAAPVRIKERLEASAFAITEGTTPSAAAALRDIEAASKLGGQLDNLATSARVGAGDDKVVGVSMQGLEGLNQKLRLRVDNAHTPADKRAAMAVRRAYNEWLDDAGENALLSGSDPAALAMYRAGRKARREHAELFESNPFQRDDDAGRIIEKFIDKDVTTTEVANYLMGAAKAGERGESTRLAARMKTILGADSPEFGSIKQGVWFKLVNGDNAAATLGPQALSTRILNFVDGKANPYAKVLYSDAERAQMRRYAAAVQMLVPDPKATNPSKSGYEIQRGVRDMASSLMGMLGTAATQNLFIGKALQMASSAATNARGSLRARTAAKGAPRRRWGDVPDASDVRGAVAGGAAGYSNTGADVPIPSLPMRMPF